MRSIASTLVLSARIGTPEVSILNSSLLGEALCIELLAQATQAVTEAGLPKGRIAAPEGE